MEEKTITLTVLAIVTIVAIVALVLLLKTSKAGMAQVVIIDEGEIYGESRYLGSGTQISTGVGHSIQQPGIYTAGSGSVSTSTSRAYDRVPFLVASACALIDENGELLRNQEGNLIIGSLHYTPTRMSSIEQRACVADNFVVSVDAMYNDADLLEMMCCAWGGQMAIPSAMQSTGVAYYYNSK